MRSLAPVAAVLIALIALAGPAPGPRAEPAVRHDALRHLGGDFTLTDQTGQRFSLHDARGKVVLLAFGFTACASTCPATLTRIGGAMRELGPRADRVQPILISIDPERDTPEALRAYLRNFHPSIRALTGSQAEIDAVTAKFRAPAHAHAPDAGGGYQVDHSSYIFVIDRGGTLVRLIRFEEPAEKIALIARSLIEEPSASAHAP